MSALLKRTLVILLALRAVAAPVALCPSNSPSSSQHRFYVVRMRCWPPQRLQRFSASSKLLQLCIGKNRLGFSEGRRYLTLRSPVPASHPRPAAPAPNAFRDSATIRLSVCLRC